MAAKHFLSLKDWSREEIEALFELAAGIKADPAPYSEALTGKSLAMIFQKPSTRTRVSFEVGMFQLGGQALFLGSNDIQLHRGETIADTAQVLSRYVDGIMARVFAHQDVLDLARHGTVPVINGLSDLLHPCQALADYFTLRERRGALAGPQDGLRGRRQQRRPRADVRGGEARVRHERRVSTGLRAQPAHLQERRPGGAEAGLPDARGDQRPDGRRWPAPTWSTPTSGPRWARRPSSRSGPQAFQGFQVTPEMMAAAKPEAVFMHCLPAHRGEEVAAEVIDGPQSVVFDEAENRLHVQKAVLYTLMGR